jgi:epoxyqueuosine reductase QueG
MAVLENLAGSDDPLIREHAAWALESVRRRETPGS